MNERVVASIGREAFPTLGRARWHVVQTDEPRDEGGTDTGPTPMELMLLSLASCTAITVKMYADRKGWRLEDVHVSVRRASDGTTLHVAMHAVGDLDEAQRARLLEIAGKCPVHRMLHDPPKIETELVSEE
ncbi:MAG: OsmC family protein [Phycisphaeraceae bacterium]|nr:OsmC family protein [Phycisphaeraceae bacterium]